MSDLKLIFFGTPQFAVDSLHEINLNYKVNCVVTSPDRKSGRGQKINESKVKQYAKKNNIKILQPENLNDKEFINQIEAIQPDLIIVVAFKQLPFEIFSIPKYGTINLHASLLPNYRGAAPINWCLINNEKKTGVTTFFINEKIDQGDVLLKEEIIINDEGFLIESNNLYASVGWRNKNEKVWNIYKKNELIYPKDDFEVLVFRPGYEVLIQVFEKQLDS